MEKGALGPARIDKQTFDAIADKAGYHASLSSKTEQQRAALANLQPCTAVVPLRDIQITAALSTDSFCNFNLLLHHLNFR
jgi:hypothetical protein